MYFNSIWPSLGWDGFVDFVGIVLLALLICFVFFFFFFFFFFEWQSELELQLEPEHFCSFHSFNMIRLIYDTFLNQNHIRLYIFDFLMILL